MLNYYGYMLADRGVRLDEATSMIQKAVKQEPNNGAYLDSLGWAYYKQNKLAEAEEYLRKAVEREAHDPTILGHLGDVYVKLGQTRARRHLLGACARRMAESAARRLRSGQGQRGRCAAEEPPPPRAEICSGDGKPQ